MVTGLILHVSKREQKSVPINIISIRLACVLSFRRQVNCCLSWLNFLQISVKLFVFINVFKLATGCINVPFLHLLFLSIGIRVSLKSPPTIGIPVPCSFKNILTFVKKHIYQCSAVRYIHTYHWKHGVFNLYVYKYHSTIFVRKLIHNFVIQWFIDNYTDTPTCGCTHTTINSEICFVFYFIFTIFI